MEQEGGLKLRELREKAGILAVDLAVELGIGNDRVSKYESGRVPLPAGFVTRYREAVARLYAHRHEQVAAELEPCEVGS